VTDAQGAAAVTVVGTGVMGSAIARALLDGGHHVVAWNRTQSRAEPLRAAGAELADRLGDAIRTSRVTIMCVAHQAAAVELLETPDVREALHGRTLVQLTTGTAAEARAGAERAREHGITYVDGAIMAYPRTIGTDAAVILYAGPDSAFGAHEALLGELGQAHHVGEDAARPAVIDAALVALFYGALAGFLHGAVLTRAEGIEVEEYLRFAGPFFAGFVSDAVRETGERVLARSFDDPQSSLHTHLTGIDRLVVRSSREAGIDPTIMEAIRDSFVQAIAAGCGAKDIACLVDVATDK
jgi:3-hydroxyisobutyrate dehydrogenase-like beta-hydroxyacid dehydrogenase